MARPPSPSSSDRPPRHRRGEKFLRGPVPLGWLTAAGRLPGHALHVGIALWFRAGLQDSRTVKLSQKSLREFGVSRFSAYRGLRQLEQAGLVEARRSNGKLARVTILEAPRDRSSPRSPASDAESSG